MGDNKVKALHYFIKEATVGELNYIIEDISNILGSKDFINEPEVIDALRTYYESHLTHHTLPEGTEVLVTEKGRREAEGHKEAEGEGETEATESKPTEFTYVDEGRNTKFTLDVTTGECKLIDQSQKHPDEAVQGFKESLIESLDKYIGEQYKPNSTVGTAAVEGSDQLTVYVDISCHHLNHKNFWGGEWLSRWTVKHTLNSSDFELTGSIKIMNHYFEQGNIQFKLEKKYDSPINGTLKGGDASESIVAEIAKIEQEYKDSLTGMYEEISENHMKSLRRRLPFTGKSFDWGAPKLM